MVCQHYLTIKLAFFMSECFHHRQMSFARVDKMDQCCLLLSSFHQILNLVYLSSIM